MPDEVPGITRIAIERSQRDFPRRDGQQPGNRRQPPRHHPSPESPAAAPGDDDDPPTVGSRLNVRA
jgi:hypothetical protein